MALLSSLLLSVIFKFFRISLFSLSCFLDKLCLSTIFICHFLLRSSIFFFFWRNLLCLSIEFIGVVFFTVILDRSFISCWETSKFNKLFPMLLQDFYTLFPLFLLDIIQVLKWEFQNTFFAFSILWSSFTKELDEELRWEGEKNLHFFWSIMYFTFWSLNSLFSNIFRCFSTDFSNALAFWSKVAISCSLLRFSTSSRWWVPIIKIWHHGCTNTSPKRHKWASKTPYFGLLFS